MKPSSTPPEGANCGLCGRQVVLGFWFKAHMESVHLDTLASYNCKLCGKGNFPAKEDFLAHVEEAHQSALTEGGASTSNDSKETDPRKCAANGSSERIAKVSPTNQEEDEVTILDIASGDDSMSEGQDCSGVRPGGGSSGTEAGKKNQSGEREDPETEASMKDPANRPSDQEEAKNCKEVDTDSAPTEDTPSNKLGTVCETTGKISKKTCTICDKEFAHIGSLNQHLKAVHMGIKSRVCKACGKAFTQGQDLKGHVAHCSGKPSEGTPNENAGTSCKQKSKEKCPICGKEFAHKFRMQMHIKTVHLGIKAHVCKHCDKGYSQSHSLKKHVARVHGQAGTTSPGTPVTITFKKKEKAKENGHGPKVANCPVDSEAVHKKHSCHICGKVYALKSSVADHVNAVHLGVKAYRCQKCNLAFRFRSYRSAHAKKCQGKVSQVEEDRDAGQIGLKDEA